MRRYFKMIPLIKQGKPFETLGKQEWLCLEGGCL